MALQNETKLNNGVTMPLQGYGVFQITDEAVCKEGVKAALAAGVRLIDTAACYGNERAVGTAIRESDVPRKDIFISSKVWIQDAGYEKTKASFAKTLENLGTDYLDLYLIHMPYGDYHGAWRAMEELYKAGKIRAIGVCNFLPDRLLDLILTHDVVPAVHGILRHPPHGLGAVRRGPVRHFHGPDARGHRRTLQKNTGAGHPPLALAGKHHRHPEIHP